MNLLSCYACFSLLPPTQPGYSSEWLKNSSCCSQSVRVRAWGECAARLHRWGAMLNLYESSVRTCGTQRSTPSLQSGWLLFFFFKTENNRFTTGLFKQTLTLNLPTPTKWYQKCTIVLIHICFFLTLTFSNDNIFLLYLYK